MPRLVWVLILLGLPSPLPFQEGFQVTFFEVVHYPDFGVSDTFLGRLAFRGPDRVRIEVEKPEPGTVWVQGDTAWVRQDRTLQSLQTPFPPGIFLLEQADSFRRRAEGIVLYYSRRLAPEVDSACLWLSPRGVPESLRIWSPQAVFFFRFSSFVPKPPPPDAFSPPHS
jgi:hypothetical protein